MNYHRLNEKIEQKGFKKSFVASQLNITHNSLNYKMKGGVFKQGEIYKLKKLLNLTPEELNEIFF